MISPVLLDLIHGYIACFMLCYFPFSQALVSHFFDC